MVETKVERTGTIYEIIVRGEVDASSSIQLDNELEVAFNANETNVLINLEGLEYISSAGLGVFIARLEEVKEKEINLSFCNLRENVAEVFNLLGLDELLTIYSERNIALEKMQ